MHLVNISFVVLFSQFFQNSYKPKAKDGSPVSAGSGEEGRDTKKLDWSSSSHESHLCTFTRTLYFYVLLRFYLRTQMAYAWIKCCHVPLVYKNLSYTNLSFNLLTSRAWGLTFLIFWWSHWNLKNIIYARITNEQHSWTNRITLHWHFICDIFSHIISVKLW